MRPRLRLVPFLPAVPVCPIAGTPRPQRDLPRCRDQERGRHPGDRRFASPAARARR